MSFKVDHLPGPVASCLRAYFRRRRFYRFLRFVLLSVSVYLLLALVAMHLDRFMFLSSGFRVTLFWIVHILAGCFALAALAAFALRRVSVRSIAYELESRLSEDAAEHFVTLDNVLGKPETPDNPVREDLVNQLRAATVARGRSVKAGRLVRDRLVRVFAIFTLSVVSVYGLLFLAHGYQFPLMVERFLSPRANLPKPSFMHIRASPANPVVGKGDEVVIRAEIEGRIPRGLGWIYALTGSVPSRCMITFAEGRRKHLEIDPETARDMTRVKRTLFLYPRPQLEKSFSYRMRCGDAMTEVRFVEVVSQPEITELKVSARPPAYTGLPPTATVNPGGPLRFFRDSEITVTFKADQSVVSRTITVDGKREVKPEWNEKTGTGRYCFQLEKKVELEVDVVNEKGFANVDPAKVSIVLLEDKKPTVRLHYPAGDLTSVPGGLIPLRAAFKDDLEISEVALQYRLNPSFSSQEPVKEIELPFAAEGVKEAVIADSFDLGQTDAKPGDEVEMQLRVRDSGGNDRLSRAVRVSVCAFTRGENERRRLEVLRFFSEALGLLSKTPPEPGGSIPEELYDRISELGAAASVSLQKRPNVDSLLDVMEREHHFTGAPRHKEDVRKICICLRSGWELDLSGFSAAITEELLPSLIRYRRLKNITWRLFGMRYEVKNIRSTITDLEAEKRAHKEKVRKALEAFTRNLNKALENRNDIRDAYAKEKELAEKVEKKADTTGREYRIGGYMDDRVVAPAAGGGSGGEKNGKNRKEISEKLDNVRKKQTRLSSAFVAERIQTWRREHREIARNIKEEDLDALAHRMVVSVLEKGGPSAMPSRFAATLAVPSSGKRKMLRRRGRLYFNALQDLGVELLELSAGCRTLDHERLSSLQGELNTAANSLTRGGSSRIGAACTRLDSLLVTMLNEIIPALPGLCSEERKARKQLDALYSTMLRKLSQGPPEDACEDRRISAEALVSCDLRMMERNPFLPFRPQLVSVVLSEALAGDRTAESISEVLEPDEEVARAAAGRRELWKALACSWHLNSVLEMDRISNTEKMLAAHLSALETGVRKDLPAIDAGRKHSAPVNTARALLRELLAPVSPQKTDRLLSEAAAKHCRFPGPAAAVGELLNHVKAMEGLVEELQGVLNRGGGVKAKAKAMSRRFHSLVSEYRRYMRLVRMRFSVIEPLAANAAREEAAFLSLREGLARFQGAAAPPLSQLGGVSEEELDSVKLANLQGDLSLIKRGTTGLKKALENTRKLCSDQTVERIYRLQDVFKETRVLLRTAVEVAGSATPSDLVRAFMRKWEYAGLEHIASKSTMLQDAGESLSACEEVLRREAAAEDYEVHLERAESVLETFRKAVERSAPGDLKNSAVREVTEIIKRLKKVQFKEGEAESVERSRCIFELGEALKALEMLSRKIGAATEMTNLVRAAYRGGPEGIWNKQLYSTAEASRKRLLSQVRYARQQATLGILAGLEEQPGRQAFSEAYAWAVFLHRVARSPLSGSVARAARKEEAYSRRPPLVRWLTEQLEEAQKEARKPDRLKHYGVITLEMIESMKDLLRY